MNDHVYLNFCIEYGCHSNPLTFIFLHFIGHWLIQMVAHFIIMSNKRCRNFSKNAEVFQKFVTYSSMYYKKMVFEIKKKSYGTYFSVK